MSRHNRTSLYSTYSDSDWDIREDASVVHPYSDMPPASEEFIEAEPLEETPDRELPEDSNTSPLMDKKTAAMKLIAGEFGEDASDIRERLSELGLDYDEITDVKTKILNGTYFAQ